LPNPPVAGRRRTPFDVPIANAYVANYKNTVADCLKTSGDGFLIPFDMAMRVGTNGAVEKIFLSIISNTSLCVSAKVQAGVFPPPPKPSYWVKVSVR
jgi:hypothetical protein